MQIIITNIIHHAYGNKENHSFNFDGNHDTPMPGRSTSQETL